MAIGKLLPRRAPPLRASVSARPDIRCRKAWPRGRGGTISPIRLKNFEALSLRRYHSRERNVKPVQWPEHNTVPGKMPTAQIGLCTAFSKGRAGRGQGLPGYGFGVSSLNRPAPPWPSGFSSSGRIVLSSPESFQGGLTIRSPAEVRPPAAACGETLNSRRRHFAGCAPAPAVSATWRARLSVARRLFTGYHNR